MTQTYHPYLAGGGMPVKVRAISRILARRGHTVAVLTADLGPRNPGASCDSEQAADNTEIFYLPTLARYRALTLNPRVIRFCRASLARFDVVHCYGLYDLLGPSVGFFCRRRALPYFVEPMGMFRPIDRSLHAKRAWHATMGRSFLSGAARVVATSNLEKEELLQSGIPAAKIMLRYNGIDPDVFTSLPPRGAFRTKHGIPLHHPMLLFLSRLIPRKRADVLIQAFADARPGRGVLVIAGPEGESGYRSFLERCARDAGIENHVLFTGPLYAADRQSAFVDADVFALPSLYENFANAPAEAIACGVPVIVSPFCGIAPLIEGRAGLVTAPERTLLSSALRRLLTDSDLHTRFKAGCGEVARELDWEHLVAQMENTYGDALKEACALRQGASQVSQGE